MKAKIKRSKVVASKTSRSAKRKPASQRLVSRVPARKRPAKRPAIKKTVRAKKKVSRRAKRILIPHAGNQYRPHLIRWQGLAVMLAIILLGQGIYNYAVSGHFSVLGRTTTTSISGLLADTNKVRATDNLPPLKLNTKLDQAAYDKAQDMFKHDYWAHVSPSGVQPWDWVSKVNYNYNEAGENLAKNYPTSTATVDAWMASPTHRANVLGKGYTDVGFAVASGQLQGQETSLVVAYYAEPEPGAVLASTHKTTAAGFSEPVHQSQGFVAGIGSDIQALSPATLGSIILIGLAILVALVTYQYRDVIPRRTRRKWAVHHAAYKAAALLVVVFILIISTHGGQI